MAGQIHYGANEHQAQWLAEGDRLACRLRHDIPRYGEAIFERQAGGELRFRLEARREPREVAMARLVSAPPQWMHDTMPRDLGQVDVRLERATINLPEAQAQRLLIELEHGMFPSLSFSDWADGRDEVVVSLSAVRIREALSEFLLCQDAQFPYAPDEIRNTIVQFAFDKSDLSLQARQRLDLVAEYMLLDETIEGVLLEGRTDSRGGPRYNDTLSMRRAQAVRDYLHSKGITEERFQFSLQAYGERRPLASNRSETGRAQNRTVAVTLQGG